MSLGKGGRRGEGTKVPKKCAVLFEWFPQLKNIYFLPRAKSEWQFGKDKSRWKKFCLFSNFFSSTFFSKIFDKGQFPLGVIFNVCMAKAGFSFGSKIFVDHLDNFSLRCRCSRFSGRTRTCRLGRSRGFHCSWVRCSRFRWRTRRDKTGHTLVRTSLRDRNSYL